jgi:hypothetical protein
VAEINTVPCADLASLTVFADSGDSRQTPAWLRGAVSCGDLKADGTVTVDGVTAIKLTGSIGPQKEALTYYVSPATYLPVRMTLGHRVQADFQWLPPTPANLAKLALPTPPAGFTQAHNKPVSVRPSPTPTAP